MKNSNLTSRRNFMKSFTAAAVGGTVFLLSGCNSVSSSHRKKSIIQKGGIILFQGDSITDAGRDKRREANANDRNALGKGYVYSVATQLLADRAGDGLKIYNRGISGNKVFQLADRWDKDCLDLKPDIVSILIGVNDIWHTLNGNYAGTVEKYENDYRALLNRTRNALPSVQLVICEPFVLRCGAVNDKWFPEFDKYRAVSKKMSKEFNALFVPFQTMFDNAVKKALPAHWAGDGVHPSMAGAYLMGQEWLKVVTAHRG
ncbi:MAG: lysophospholipase [Phycisphaerae bacterium]|nr:SGNH/GDSL hydrolase family protein [Phycisphaerae bacterium]NIP53763.1 SGNH/GDSL hydrolase family protein [Phycisphaerae bacterium]NIS52708.1 SGNH/GDSL hydrolase family protein [Phycisphaerae bacterium]NIU10145.1 SGNH/GDSL hydrolase family protein [Phycisphaerae bacterium]NIU57857.1 lysophospholipase [Phycisphaerae bacterium]